MESKPLTKSTKTGEGKLTIYGAALIALLIAGFVTAAFLAEDISTRQFFLEKVSELMASFAAIVGSLNLGRSYLKGQAAANR